jgi:hypothetical protein
MVGHEACVWMEAYSMIFTGMAVAGRLDLSLYTELRPISEEFVPQTLAVSGSIAIDWREAPAAEHAMRAAG